MRLITFAFFLIISILLTTTLLTKLPFIWPDEAIYADVAQNILKENRIGTDLWSGMVPGIEKCMCWYSPFLFYLVAGWFRIFGFSIETQRLLSIVTAIGLLITIYLLTKLFLKNEKNSVAPWFYMLPIFALMTDFTFTQASRIGRPEIFVLFFGFLSLLLFTKFDNNRSSLKLIFSSGFFAGISFVAHFLGIFFMLSILVYWILTERIKILKSKSFYLLIIGFILPLVAWLITIFPYLSIAKEQFILTFLKKTGAAEENWLALVFAGSQTWGLTAVYVGYVIPLVVFLIDIIVTKKKKYLLLGIVFCFAWITALYGKMLWYYVYPIPFAYLAYTLILYDFVKLSEKEKTITRKISAVVIMICFATTIFLNIELNLLSVTIRAGSKFSYPKMVDTVLNLIPEGKTIFLSSIPDLYFGLKTSGKQYKLYEFTPVKQTRQAYGDYLNKSDFAVYTGNYDWSLYSTFLLEYIEKNQYKAYHITEPAQHELYVVEFVPRDKRVTP